MEAVEVIGLHDETLLQCFREISFCEISFREVSFGVHRVLLSLV